MQEQIIKLIARDRIEIPLSSMYQKVKKAKSNDAKGLAQLLGPSRFEDNRVYAFVETTDKEKARGMKEAVAEFTQEFPKYGAILAGKIAEKRILAEEHLYVGVQAGKHLTSDDYVSVMQSLGLSQNVARNLYPDLINVSRKLANAREEERTFIVGKYEQDE